MDVLSVQDRGELGIGGRLVSLVVASCHLVFVVKPWPKDLPRAKTFWVWDLGCIHILAAGVPRYQPIHPRHYSSHRSHLMFVFAIHPFRRHTTSTDWEPYLLLALTLLCSSLLVVKPANSLYE